MPSQSLTLPFSPFIPSFSRSSSLIRLCRSLTAPLPVPRTFSRVSPLVSWSLFFSHSLSVVRSSCPPPPVSYVPLLPYPLYKDLTPVFSPFRTLLFPFRTLSLSLSLLLTRVTLGQGPRVPSSPQYRPDARKGPRVHPLSNSLRRDRTRDTPRGPFKGTPGGQGPLRAPVANPVSSRLDPLAEWHP